VSKKVVEAIEFLEIKPVLIFYHQIASKGIKIMRNKLFFTMALISLFAFSGFAQKPETLSGGVLNGKATSLPKPVYPQAAQAVRASGEVKIQVMVDENGDVISASAFSGHPLLRQSAEQAARLAKFAPTVMGGKTIRMQGVLIYNFVLPVNWRYVGVILGDAEAEIEDEIKLGRVVGELGNLFPDESKAIKIVVENFDRDEEAGRYQTAAIIQVINSLQAKISVQAEDVWHFELGLTIGRLNASSFEDSILRESLSKFKQLSDTAPENINKDTLAALRSLGEMAGKNVYTRRDKKTVKELVSEL
jgi:TonB family protein